MANYYIDNQDIRFQLEQLNLRELAETQERETLNGEADYVPESIEEMVENYHQILEIVGAVAAETIAPSAEQVDIEGNTHNANEGTVTLHPLVQRNLDRLNQADALGFTLPRKYGGINCPISVYTAATEMVARADCAFMNMFGLQGIADTIYAFASEEIKDKYLPLFAAGKVTGAMVLTEPDAGSDLQAVRLRADQDKQGNWVLNGVKRFITNGCGEILLVLARSEPEISDGRGLSLFLCERSPAVKVRCLEKKLGIHGSPTCELVFENTPGILIGERQRGLITYVIALMNGARLGIAAQSLGVAEAAFRLARVYAHTREQFGGPIERLAPVAEMVTDMQISIEAARALTYETARVCDLENNINRLLALDVSQFPESERKPLKPRARTYKRLNAMLTPMSKYFASEMSIEVTNKAVQVLGGSGFLKDYAAERYLRDARITNIYEGTSQLQVVAAVRGITSGVFETFVKEMEERRYENPLLEELKGELIADRERVSQAVEFAKEKGGAFVELIARQLVDSAIAIIIGHFFLSQGKNSARKVRVAHYWIKKNRAVIAMKCDSVLLGNTQAVEEYELLAGPVPVLD